MKSIKWVFLAGFCASFCSAALADGYFHVVMPQYLPDYNGAFQGPYAGIGTGLNFVESRLKIKWENSPGTFSNETYKHEGMATNLYAGYGARFDSFYLGAELQHDFAHTELVKNPFDRDITVHNIASLDLIPGFFLENRWLVYARVGVAYLQQREQYLKIIQNDKAAGHLGAGLSYALSSHFSVRGNWMLTAAPAFTFNEGTFAVPATQHRASLTTMENEFTLDLTYHFFNQTVAS